MNDHQEERHASDKIVVRTAKENPTIISLIPDFEEGINKLDELTIEIEKISTLQARDTSGVTENKQFTIDNLRGQTLDVSGAVYSYGAKMNDILLMGKVNFKKSAMSRMTPGKIISAANITLEEAKKVPVVDMAKAGITTDELIAYEEIVTYFRTISESPREAQIETSVYTKKLIELFKAVTKLYKNTLDKLAHQFKSKAPEFYFKYRSARRAIHRGPNGTDTPGGTTNP